MADHSFNLSTHAKGVVGDAAGIITSDSWIVSATVNEVAVGGRFARITKSSADKTE